MQRLQINIVLFESRVNLNISTQIEIFLSLSAHLCPGFLQTTYIAIAIHRVQHRCPNIKNRYITPVLFSNEALAQRRNHFKIVFYVLVFCLSNHTSPLTRVLFLSPPNTFPLPCNTCMLFATNTSRHSTLPSLFLLPWLPPQTYSARSPLWHAKTGAHLSKCHTMLKYEYPLKCT